MANFNLGQEIQKLVPIKVIMTNIAQAIKLTWAFKSNQIVIESDMNKKIDPKSAAVAKIKLSLNYACLKIELKIEVQILWSYLLLFKCLYLWMFECLPCGYLNVCYVQRQPEWKTDN